MYRVCRSWIDNENPFYSVKTWTRSLPLNMFSQVIYTHRHLHSTRVMRKYWKPKLVRFIVSQLPKYVWKFIADINFIAFESIDRRAVVLFLWTSRFFTTVLPNIYFFCCDDLFRHVSKCLEKSLMELLFSL